MQLEARSCKSSSLTQNFTNPDIAGADHSGYIPTYHEAPSILRCLSRKCCSSFGTVSSILRSMSRNCCNFGTSSQLYSEIHEQMMLL
ncbi:hypothetical protein CY35_07G029400 [Sphagnum magellanicum]|uniref:Uncharacterized protein n=2 Tax=Sphagnum magellanicum TaxID=128215 RepID=A0ACB8HJT4_9BRYO|nr:hypothetical protein CY35_07G029400 [Sphagnum magellanicum]KAH9556473.1 hypothetical protein CY35_07G029400 [Sphagnum magellanicum]